MKKLVLIATLIMLVGCSGMGKVTIPPLPDDVRTEILINMAAIEIGCQIKKSGNSDLDKAFRDFYEYAKTGEIPQEVIDRLNKRLAEALKGNETLALQIPNMLKLAGLSMPLGEDSQVNVGLIDFSTVPPGQINAAVSGYNSGYEICEGK
jgi:hypothetical protein